MSESPEYPQHDHDALAHAILQQLNKFGLEWNEIVAEILKQREAGVHAPPGFVKLSEQQLGQLMSKLNDPWFTDAAINHKVHWINLFTFFYELGKRHGKADTEFVPCHCPTELRG